MAALGQYFSNDMAELLRDTNLFIVISIVLHVKRFVEKAALDRSFLPNEEAKKVNSSLGETTWETPRVHVQRNLHLSEWYYV